MRKNNSKSKEKSQPDLRKLNSGRKAKSHANTLQDYLENMTFKGWLKCQDINVLGDIKKSISIALGAENRVLLEIYSIKIFLYKNLSI